MIFTREEAVEYIKSQSPSAFLKPDRQHKGFVCPDCHNGSGSSGDGIRKIPGRNQYKCFKCGMSGDIFDLIGIEYGLSDFNDQFKKATEIYDVEVEKYRSVDSEPKNDKIEKASDTETVEAMQSSYAEYLYKCQLNVGQTSYFKERGLSDETVKKLAFGYDPEYSSKATGGKVWKAAILPSTVLSYEVRNTEVSPNSKTDSANKYRKEGKTYLFRAKDLFNDHSPIFIVEGIMDAASIIECGGVAVSMQSVANWRLITDQFSQKLPKQPLILLLDNDEAGMKATIPLKEALTELNVPFIEAPEVIGTYHDPNDRLINDRAGLESAIKDAVAKARQLGSPVDEAREKYLKTSAAYSVDALRESIKQYASRPVFSTGFKSLDDAFDGGLYSGLYIIGAISSLGKTTLTLQFADNLAKQGRDVLFFSLEQSRNDLMSKSISRETFLYCKENNLSDMYAKTNLTIMDGRKWQRFGDKDKTVVNNAFDSYAEYSKHIFIYEGLGNISVAEIRKAVKDHISFTGNEHPIVFIDYLQILKAADGCENRSDKQIVDVNVTALKQLSRDFDITVFAVSSLNRQNYAEKINMSAFKESGAIEYGSDVLIGLELKGAGEKDFKVIEAKKRIPREIMFCILKNRNGKIFDEGIELHFYPMFNCFTEASGEVQKVEKTDKEDKVMTDEGGFMQVSLEDEAYLQEIGFV